MAVNALEEKQNHIKDRVWDREKPQGFPDPKFLRSVEEVCGLAETVRHVIH